MKAIKTNTQPFKNAILGFCVTVIIFTMSGCAKKNIFQTSSVVPAARGFVQVKKDKNKNNVIDIQVSNLAEVERLIPLKNTYVIWMLTDENLTKNIGQIKSSTGLISKQLKASFKTVSAFKPVKIFLTVEEDASATFPGAYVILTTDTF